MYTEMAGSTFCNASAAFVFTLRISSCCLGFVQPSNHALCARCCVRSLSVSDADAASQPRCVLQSNSHGSILSHLGRQLVDGHWVLSFPTPQSAQYAQEMVQQHTAQLRTLHGEVMLPMLTPLSIAKSV